MPLNFSVGPLVVTGAQGIFRQSLPAAGSRLYSVTAGVRESIHVRCTVVLESRGAELQLAKGRVGGGDQIFWHGDLKIPRDVLDPRIQLIIDNNSGSSVSPLIVTLYELRPRR